MADKGGHIDFMFLDPLYLAAGSATGWVLFTMSKTRMHLCRMRTARSLPYRVGRSLSRGRLCWGGVSAQGDPLLPVDRQMPLKNIPCPKRRLRALKMQHLNKRAVIFIGTEQTRSAQVFCSRARLVMQKMSKCC